jgi:hypothetical protein
MTSGYSGQVVLYKDKVSPAHPLPMPAMNQRWIASSVHAAWRYR